MSIGEKPTNLREVEVPNQQHKSAVGGRGGMAASVPQQNPQMYPQNMYPQADVEMVPDDEPQKSKTKGLLGGILPGIMNKIGFNNAENDPVKPTNGPQYSKGKYSKKIIVDQYIEEGYYRKPIEMDELPPSNNLIHF